MSPQEELELLRQSIHKINFELLNLLTRRGEIVREVARVKQTKGLDSFDPQREGEMIAELKAANSGPYPDETIGRLFKAIFEASVELIDQSRSRVLLVSRKNKLENTCVKFELPAVLNGDKPRKITIGDGEPVIIAGPCSVENRQQMEAVGEFLSCRSLNFIRAGAFKPRTSPYHFQGLCGEGLKLLGEIRRKFGLLVVTELTSSEHLEKVLEVADIIQVGARNMYNYDLLKELGKVQRPVLLKRSFMATVEEFKQAAEYILAGGNHQVILCERGIRTFEHATRNTLDISAVPILKQETHLPVLIDISHASGRTDILPSLAAASLAAGADGLMIEVHPQPEVARSDAQQQLNFQQFDQLLNNLGINLRFRRF